MCGMSVGIQRDMINDIARKSAQTCVDADLVHEENAPLTTFTKCLCLPSDTLDIRRTNSPDLLFLQLIQCGWSVPPGFRISSNNGVYILIKNCQISTKVGYQDVHSARSILLL